MSNKKYNLDESSDDEEDVKDKNKIKKSSKSENLKEIYSKKKSRKKKIRVLRSKNKRQEELLNNHKLKDKKVNRKVRNLISLKNGKIKELMRERSNTQTTLNLLKSKLSDYVKRDSRINYVQSSRKFR